jgi:hypothetical protein
MEMSGIHSVQQLRSDLERAQQDAVRIGEQARAAADRLRAAPCREHQAERDRLISEGELAELRARLLESDLAEVEREKARCELEQLSGEHREALGQVEPLRQRIERGVAEVEAAIAAIQGLRRAARKRTHEARRLHFLLGGEEHDQPAYTVAVRNPPLRAAAKSVDMGDLGGVALGAWRSMRTRSTMPSWRCSA